MGDLIGDTLRENERKQNSSNRVGNNPTDIIGATLAENEKKQSNISQPSKVEKLSIPSHASKAERVLVECINDSLKDSVMIKPARNDVKFTQEQQQKIIKKNIEVGMKSDELAVVSPKQLVPLYSVEGKDTGKRLDDEDIKYYLGNGDGEKYKDGIRLLEKIDAVPETEDISNLPSIAKPDNLLQFKSLLANGDIVKDSNGKYQLATTPTANYYRARSNGNITAQESFLLTSPNGQSIEYVGAKDIDKLLLEGKIRLTDENTAEYIQEKKLKSNKLYSSDGNLLCDDFGVENIAQASELINSGMVTYSVHLQGYVLASIDDMTAKNMENYKQQQSAEEQESPNATYEDIRKGFGTHIADVTKNLFSGDKKSRETQMAAEQSGSFSVPLDNDMYDRTVNIAQQVVTKPERDYYQKSAVQKVSVDGVKRDIQHVANKKYLDTNNEYMKELTEIGQQGSPKSLVLDALKSVYIESLIDDCSPIKSLTFIYGKVIANDVAYECQFPKEVIDYLPIGIDKELYKHRTQILWDMLEFYSISKSKHYNLRNLTEISFDDSRFAFECAQALVHGGTAGMSTFFRVFPNLQRLMVAGEEIKRDEINTSKSFRLKDMFRRERKSFSLFGAWASAASKDKPENERVPVSTSGWHLFDGFKPHENGVYGISDGIMNWGMDFTKAYATNRGDKGLIRYTGGVITRGCLTLGFMVGNLGIHMAGGLLKGAKNIAQTAMTPVDEI